MIDNILNFFGRIKLAEENSLCAEDFENSLTKYFTKQKRPLEKSNLCKYGKLKFGEIYSKSLDDFKTSLKDFFF